MNAVLSANVQRFQAWRTWKESKLLGAVAAYEDSATAGRGIAFCRELAKTLGTECALTPQVWLFNELRVPKLMEIAAGEAAVADLVIISAHRADPVPEPVRDWLRKWLGLRSGRRAVLVVLVDAEAAEEARGQPSFWDEVAKNRDLDFLLEAEEVHASS